MSPWCFYYISHRILGCSSLPFPVMLPTQSLPARPRFVTQSIIVTLYTGTSLNSDNSPKSEYVQEIERLHNSFQTLHQCVIFWILIELRMYRSVQREKDCRGIYQYSFSFCLSCTDPIQLFAQMHYTEAVLAHTCINCVKGPEKACLSCTECNAESFKNCKVLCEFLKEQCMNCHYRKEKRCSFLKILKKDMLQL